MSARNQKVSLIGNNLCVNAKHLLLNVGGDLLYPGLFEVDVDFGPKTNV